MSTLRRFPLAFVPAALLGAALAVQAPPALAGRGDCGQVTSEGIAPKASDALFILRAAVGTRVCEHPCLCDTNSNGSTTTADALLTLQRAVGQPTRLRCSCRLPELEGLDEDAPTILPFRIQVAYNADTVFFHSSWEGDRGDTHRYLRFIDGKWRREGGSRRESQSTLDNDPVRGPTDINSTLYESRVAFALDDPAAATAVPGFYEYGCFLTCHDHNQSMPAWDGVNDLSKHLPEGSPGMLDLLHHRLHRGDPIGFSDDQFVDATVGDSGGRKPDAGTHAFTSQQEDAEGNPEYLIDPATSNGLFAFDFRGVFTDSLRYLRRPDTPENGGRSVAATIDYLDALEDGYVPRENDAVPLRVLRLATESAADLTSIGTFFVPSEVDPLRGTWHSNLQRLLSTGNPDDVALKAGGVFNIGIAVHTGDVTVQDHYVSFAQRLVLGGTAGADEPQPDIVAVEVVGSGREQLPDWSDTDTFPVTELNLFRPGIASRDFLNGDNVGKTYIDPRTDTAVDQTHAGASALKNSGLGCRNCHTAADADSYAPPSAGGFNAGSMETLVPLRGGVNTPTPIPPF